MPAPTIPANEASRLVALQALNILDTLPEERFDRVTRLAKKLFNVPIVLVCLVDADRVWIKSGFGLEQTDYPRGTSFCGHTILENDMLVVSDTNEDERFSDSALVVDPPNIRFYAGYPLTVSGGVRIGTLCLLDVVPRSFDEKECDLLRDLGRMVEQDFIALELATTDDLTKLANRRGFETLAHHVLTTCNRMTIPASLLFFDLRGIKQINQRFGRAEGDRAITVFADVLQRQLRGSDVVGRFGSDEFVAVVVDLGANGADEIVKRVRHNLDVLNGYNNRGYEIGFSVGRIEYNEVKHTSIACLLAEADRVIYANKRSCAVAHEHIAQTGDQVVTHLVNDLKPIDTQKYSVYQTKAYSKSQAASPRI